VIVADQKKLSVAAFFFMSLFMGPVAFIIVLLLRPRDVKPAPYIPASPGNIRQEITDLKTALMALQERIGSLERRVGQEPETIEEAVVSPLPEVQRDAPVPQAAPEALEFVLGKYWLPKIGIVLFVVGIALFISYSFHYFSPFFKIAIGYFFAVAFLVWGERLEKNPQFRRLSWAILGGAWGLFYLTTYAMHYVPATKIIANSSIELFLLWTVSVLCVKYSLKYKSWVATAFSFFFGFMTMGIGTLYLSSVIFWAILVGGVAYVAYAFGWYELLMAGLVGSYAMFVLVLAPRLMPYLHRFDDPLNFRVAFALVTTGWGIFALAIIAQKLKDRLSSRQLVSAILTNTSVYASLGYWLICHLGQAEGLPRKFAFLLILAIVHAAFAFLSRLSGKTKYIVLHSAIAMTLASFALIVKYPQLSMSFWWILEMTVLFGLGVYYKEQTYRVMGWLLGVFVTGRFFIIDLSSSQTYGSGSLVVEHAVLVGAAAAACFFFLGVFVSRPHVRAVLTQDEKDFYFFTFPLAGACILTALFGEESPARWLTLNWTVLGLGLLIMGFGLHHRAFRFSALGVLALAFGRIIYFDLAGVDNIYRIIVVIFLGAVLLGVSLIYTRVKENPL
jgi:hypothetical protein